jgi:hypothetical protein
MKAKAIKAFLHDQLGRVEKGQEFEATEAQLAPVRGFIEVYETKVVQDKPREGADPDTPKRRKTKAEAE